MLSHLKFTPFNPYFISIIRSCYNILFSFKIATNDLDALRLWMLFKMGDMQKDEAVAAALLKGR